MVWDILRLQDAMVFGKGKETIDVEADESQSQFQNWGVINDSSGGQDVLLVCLVGCHSARQSLEFLFGEPGRDGVAW